MPTKYVCFTIEVYARVDCEMETSDYGVPGSPVFVDPNPDTFEVSNVSICDVNLNLESLPKKLKDILEEEAIETSYHEGEWE